MIGTLVVSPGANTPGASTRLINARAVPQLQAQLVAGTNEALRITQVSCTASGTGDDVADISSAALYVARDDKQAATAFKLAQFFSPSLEIVRLGETM